MREYFIINYYVYPFTLLVSFQKDYNEFKKTLKEYLPIELHKEINDNDFNGYYDGRTWMFKTGATCIRFQEFNNGLISHEALHAVIMLMDKLNIPLTDSNSESYTYLLQYIVNEIYNNYDRQRNKKDTRSDKKK